MPSCFQLVSKETGEPVNLNKVDEELWLNAGLPVSKDQWYKDWYGWVGMGLAMGHSFEKLKELVPDWLDIIEFLETRYEVRAWYEHK